MEFGKGEGGVVRKIEKLGYTFTILAAFNALIWEVVAEFGSTPVWWDWITVVSLAILALAVAVGTVLVLIAMWREW